MGIVSRSQGGSGSGSVVQLADSLLAAPAASFDFTGIPATATHLVIVVAARGDTAATTTGARLRFNNDATAIYSMQQLTGLGATAAATEEVFGTPTSAGLGQFTGATAPASGASPIIVFVPSYAGTTFFKGGSVLNGDRRGGGASGIGLTVNSFQWGSAAAVNRVTVFPTAGNLIAGSRATLYGWT